MKDIRQQLHTRSALIFWFNLLFFIVGLLALLYYIGPDIGANSANSATVERYAIILTLAGIPLALKYFHSQYKKIQSLEQAFFLRKYLQAYLIRLAILDLVMILNMIGFYVFEAQNFIFMTIITLFALLFCYPNKSALSPKAEIDENINDEQI